MPIYEYECQKCGHRVELIQKMSDAPLSECPKCKGAVKKLLAPPALQFKGSGWYITDYSDKSKAKADGASADKKPGESKPAGESAPAATSAEKKSESGGGSPASPSKSEGNSTT